MSSAMGLAGDIATKSSHRFSAYAGAKGRGRGHGKGKGRGHGVMTCKCVVMRLKDAPSHYMR
jgi:hypothetical protein